MKQQDILMDTIQGGTLVNENFLFPQAGTNFIFSVNIKIKKLKA